MSSAIDLSSPPEKYWHCSVKLTGMKNLAVVNDLSFAELRRTIVAPWNEGRFFTVSGTLVRAGADITEIKITHTAEPKEFDADRQGTDMTYELLFEGPSDPAPTPDASLVEHVCRRLPQAARILGRRSRKAKNPYEITDEYDVQDLLHAILRAYLKYSVQEDPLPKVAGAKSGRADISIEELGVLIEVKFVRGPEDQKRLFEEYSQDLVPPLRRGRWGHRGSQDH